MEGIKSYSTTKRADSHYYYEATYAAISRLGRIESNSFKGSKEKVERMEAVKGKEELDQVCGL